MKENYSKVLAICIPTYNRCNQLKENFNSLLPQITDEISHLLEIHIFDNSSPDNTEDYCRTLTESYEFIKYHRQKENIGPDGNFLYILHQDIDAQFYHLMSDDDLFAQNSINELLSFLSKNRDCGFVYLNHETFFEKQYDNNKEHNALQKSNLTSAQLNKKQFMKYVGIEVTFLSGLVFNHDFIDTEHLENYIGSNWLQTYAVFQSTKSCENNLGFFSTVTICKRAGVDIDYDSMTVFGIRIYNLFKFGYEVCGYDRKQLLKIVSQSVSFQIYRAKYQGKKRKDYPELMNIVRKEHLRFALLVSIVPNFIPKIFHYFRQIKKRSLKE